MAAQGTARDRDRLSLHDKLVKLLRSFPSPVKVSLQLPPQDSPLDHLLHDTALLVLSDANSTFPRLLQHGVSVLDCMHVHQSACC